MGEIHHIGDLAARNMLKKIQPAVFEVVHVDSRVVLSVHLSPLTYFVPYVDVLSRSETFTPFIPFSHCVL